MGVQRGRWGRLTSWAWVVVILLAATPVVAQFPDHYTNLKVFPKDLSRKDLEANMRGFAFALNVHCPYCHVQNADKKFDFQADDKETKKTARVMLQMVAAINQDYLSKIGKAAPVRVECATCHRGLTQPRMLQDVLAEAYEKEGIDGAVKKYHELRSQYYGTGQYDFGETPLNLFTESLMAQGKNKEAVMIMEMNFAANNQTSVWAYHMLAMSHQASGEIEKAKADFRKVVELHPEDTWAKQQLDSLSSNK